MTCTEALVSLFLLTPCDGGGGPQAIEAAVADSARPEADISRDAQRQPEEILQFFGIEPGMTVFEMFSGSGYYTQILDGVVGDQGQVLAHNNQAYLAFVGPQFESRFEDGGMANTHQMIAEANELQFDNASIDATLMILTYHDFLFSDEQYQWPDVDETAFLAKLCAAMKPGAVLGVIDHIAEPGGNAPEIAEGIHRIDPETVKSDILGSCFKLDAESFVLRNAADDHTGNATTPPMAGVTDRFVLKFVRQ